MENKKNYQKLLQKELVLLENSKNKPKLLLHACCGPCFTIPYEILKDYFDITIMYNNSNIYPKKEHDRRLLELKKYLQDINANIKIIETKYDNEKYNQDLESRASDKEGHERCRICFRKRLKEGFEYAYKNGFEFFGTVMTISRYKNAQDINKIGEELQKNYPTVKWLYADFKKNDGYEKSLIIIKNHEMYFQEYCGCIYSYEAYQKKNKKEKEFSVIRKNQEMIKLIIPSQEYLQSYIEAFNEYVEHNVSTYHLTDASKCDIFTKFDNYRNERNLPENRVGEAKYWLVNDETKYFIGEIAIRYRLNDSLSKRGGHIGYGVRYSEWNRGYGTKMLALGLEIAKEMCISPILITCNDDNLASARVLEKNGFVLKDKIFALEDGKEYLTRRYWKEII